MSKYNTSVAAAKRTVNHMGSPAVQESPELELVSLLLTSFMSDSYYRTEADTTKRLAELVEANDPLFAAKAAVYARKTFGMRSASHMTAACLAPRISGQPWAKDFFRAVVKRPDDMTEILACHQAAGNKKLPNALKKGFAAAFGQFDEYALAKYRKEGKGFSLVDVVNLVHPKPIQANAAAIEKLVKGTLKSTDTWEAKLTEAGKQAKSEEGKMEMKAAAWGELLQKGGIGIFAVLRNLRNIIQQAPEHLDAALAILTDEKRIKNSLILPFRYLTAYGEIEKMGNKPIVFEKDAGNDKVLRAIEKAVLLSVNNMPTLQGRTVILSDNSGSMRGDAGGASVTSAMSRTTTADIANLFALLYWLKADNTFVGLFGDELLMPKLDRSKGLFENFKIVNSVARRCGAGTEAGIFTAIQAMIDGKIGCDTMVVFSDNQIGNGCGWYGHAATECGSDFMRLFAEYQRMNRKFRAYSINLKGYGDTVFNGNVIKIAGWSEKIFEIMKFAEQDKNALINKIKAVEF